MENIVLIIPPFLKKKVNKYSLFLEKPFDNLSVQTLFLRKENKDYLVSQLKFLLKNHNFIKHCDEKNNRNEQEEETRLKILCSASEAQLENFIIVAQKARIIDIPMMHNNPVMDLHELNLKTLYSIGEQIITDPNIIDEDYNKTFQGKVEKNEYSFNQNSFRGGSWHPEDLFLNSRNNEKNPYFSNYQIIINPDDPNQPGNRWKKSQNSKVPFWQNPNKRRNYENVTEGLVSYSESLEQNPRMTFRMNDERLKEKKENPEDYYLRFPESAKYECKKINLKEFNEL